MNNNLPIFLSTAKAEDYSIKNFKIFIKNILLHLFVLFLFT